MVMLARCISKQWLSKYVYGSLRDITPTPLLPPSPFLYLQQRIKNFSFPEQYDMNFSKLCLYFFLPSAPHLVFFSSSAPSPPPKKKEKSWQRKHIFILWSSLRKKTIGLSSYGNLEEKSVVNIFGTSSSKNGLTTEDI